MHRLNSEAFHVDLMRSTDILARIETVDSIEYSEEQDGDFTCTIVIQGTIEMRPPGVSISDAVGIVLEAILEADVSDSGTEITFTPDGRDSEGEGSRKVSAKGYSPV